MNYMLYDNGPSRDLAIKPRRSNENGVEKGIWAVIDSIPHIAFFLEPYIIYGYIG